MILEFPGVLSRECSSPKGQRGRPALEDFSTFCQNTGSVQVWWHRFIIVATYEAEMED